MYQQMQIQFFQSAKCLALTACLWAVTLSGNLQAEDSGEANRITVINALLKTIEATNLAAEVSGKIEELDAAEGTHVKAGQSLGRIRDNSIKLRCENAKIAMAIARKKEMSNIELRLAEHRAAVANNELERALTANRSIADTYSIKEVERLRLVADSAALEIERAKEDAQLAALEVLKSENDFLQASELLELHQIKSPVDGIVVAVQHRVGEWVEPGTELLKIVKNDRLRIEGFVSAVDASHNLASRTAKVTVATAEAEREVDGTVIFVSPDANPVNGQVRVFLELDNRDGEFRPGMRVQAFIETNL